MFNCFLRANNDEVIKLAFTSFFKRLHHVQWLIRTVIVDSVERKENKIRK